MVFTAGCPRCASPVTRGTATWSCPNHGPIAPLWRPQVSSYEAFGQHLLASAGFPTYLPWPLGPGWLITDFASVREDPDTILATMVCCSGTSELDGPVDVFIVTEEMGTGLGARCAGLATEEPQIDEGPPTVKVRIGSLSVPLWAVSTSGADDEFDRSVFVGEAEGRWLWLVLRPASAMLLLRDDWILRDVSGVGAPLVELEFGGTRPIW